MKINNINNYNLLHRKNKNTSPSFNASIKIVKVNPDKVSKKLVDISKPQLRELVNLIVPELQKLDNNLHIIISGVGTPDTFFNNLFSTYREGLKFNLQYKDINKYYAQMLKDPYLKTQILAPHTYEGLMRRDPVLMSQGLTDHISVGKLFKPDAVMYPETPQQYVRVVMAKLKEHLRLFPKFVTECQEMQYNEKTKQFTRIAGLLEDGRSTNHKYRGVEFDYDPVFISYYKDGLDFNLAFRNRKFKGKSSI